jgi:hypothetical protein
MSASTSAVLAGLRRRYAAPEWAMLTEVRTSTGFAHADGFRIADVLGVALWPSAGGKREGVEIKIDRGDFAREMRHPGKSAPFREVCTAWYLAVPAPWKHVVQARSSVPEGWGLLEVGTGDPVVVVPAPERNAAELPHGIMLALLRAATRETAAGEAAMATAALPDMPSQPVTRPYLSRTTVGLSCGHAVLRPLTKTLPPKLPCGSCALGHPTDREMVLAAIEDANAEDLSRFEAALAARGAA